MIDGFLGMIEIICSEQEISRIFIDEVSNDHGSLVLRYRLPPELDKDTVDQIGARAFAVQNRSVVCCVRCGRIVTKLPSGTMPILCSRHARSFDISCTNNGSDSAPR
jgi:hypothetical protein